MLQLRRPPSLPSAQIFFLLLTLITPLFAADEVAFIGIAPTFNAATPGDGSTGVPVGTALTWDFTGASTYDLHFGTTNPPPVISAGISTTTATPAEAALKTYFWQVDATNSFGTTSTAVFSFTTAALPKHKKSGPCDLGAATDAASANSNALQSLIEIVVAGLIAAVALALIRRRLA